MTCRGDYRFAMEALPRRGATCTATCDVGYHAVGGAMYPEPVLSHSVVCADNGVFVQKLSANKFPVVDTNLACDDLPEETSLALAVVACEKKCAAWNATAGHMDGSTCDQDMHTLFPAWVHAGSPCPCTRFWAYDELRSIRCCLKGPYYDPGLTTFAWPHDDSGRRG